MKISSNIVNVIIFLALCLRASDSYAQSLNLQKSGRVTGADGSPASDPADLEIRFFSKATADSQLGATIANLSSYQCGGFVVSRSVEESLVKQSIKFCQLLNDFKFQVSKDWISDAIDKQGSIGQRGDDFGWCRWLVLGIIIFPTVCSRVNGVKRNLDVFYKSIVVF